LDILGGSHKVGGRWIEVSAEQFAQTEGLIKRKSCSEGMWGEETTTFLISGKTSASRKAGQI